MSNAKTARPIQYISAVGMFVPLISAIVVSTRPGNGVDINPLEMTLYGAALFFGLVFFTAILVDINKSFDRRIELAKGLAPKEDWEAERQARTLDAIRNR